MRNPFAPPANLFFNVIWSDNGHNKESGLFGFRSLAIRFRNELDNPSARIIRVYL